METITEKSLTLRMKTSKGGVLEETFNNYAELFDFITNRVMGDSAYDKDATEMIQHVNDQLLSAARMEIRSVEKDFSICPKASYGLAYSIVPRFGCLTG